MCGCGGASGEHLRLPVLGRRDGHLVQFLFRWTLHYGCCNYMGCCNNMDGICKIALHFEDLDHG